MEMKTSQLNGVAILELVGRFDAYSAPQVEKHLQQVVAQPPHVIVDLGGVNFVDSTALATLVKALKRCREHDGDLLLCNFQKPVRIIIELTRLDKAFSIFAFQEEALERFSNG